MFNLFKEKKDMHIYAPLCGKCIDITEVNDIAFSSKTMGDGVAFLPESNTVVAPCDGTLQMIFKTGHAFGIRAESGFEILIHIGIDTVNLEGQGFKILKKVNEKVKMGEPIINFDLETIQKSYDVTTLMIVTNGKMFNKLSIHNIVNTGDIVLEGVK